MAPVDLLVRKDQGDLQMPSFDLLLELVEPEGGQPPMQMMPRIGFPCHGYRNDRQNTLRVGLLLKLLVLQDLRLQPETP